MAGDGWMDELDMRYTYIHYLNTLHMHADLVSFVCSPAPAAAREVLPFIENKESDAGARTRERTSSALHLLYHTSTGNLC